MSTDPVVVTEKYKGSCHCGKFALEISIPSLEHTQVFSCNCSICTQKGYLPLWLPKENVQLTRGSIEEFTEYKFLDEVVSHYFCPVCGCGIMLASSNERAINMRSVDGIDLGSLKLKYVDGKNFRPAA